MGAWKFRLVHARRVLPLGSCAGAARGQGYPSGTVAEHCWHDLQQLVIMDMDGRLRHANTAAWIVRGCRSWTRLPLRYGSEHCWHDLQQLVIKDMDDRLRHANTAAWIVRGCRSWTRLPLRYGS